MLYPNTGATSYSYNREIEHLIIESSNEHDSWNISNNQLKCPMKDTSVTLRVEIQKFKYKAKIQFPMSMILKIITSIEDDQCRNLYIFDNRSGQFHD